MTLSFCCVCGFSSVPWKLCTNIGGRFSTGLLPVFCVCRRKTRWNRVYHKYCWKSGKLNVEHHKLRVPLNFGAKTKTKLHSCSNGWSSIMLIWSLFRTRKATATYLTPLCWHILHSAYFTHDLLNRYLFFQEYLQHVGPFHNFVNFCKYPSLTWNPVDETPLSFGHAPLSKELLIPQFSSLALASSSVSLVQALDLVSPKFCKALCDLSFPKATAVPTSPLALQGPHRQFRHNQTA